MSQQIPAPAGDRPMMPTYVSVLAVQIAVTIALWWVGRVFSR
jgi:hypothetical protein